MSVFIEVEENRIKSIYSGKIPSGSGRDYRSVPISFPGNVGQNIAEFTEEWDLRPLAERLEAKLIPDAERYKAVGEELVPKTIEELVRDGITEPPAGMKIDPTAPADAPRLIPMTREELVKAGQLEAVKAHKLDLADEESRLLAYLAETGWYAERDADYRATEGQYGKVMPIEIAAQRQAARDRISAIRAELAA